MSEVMDPRPAPDRVPAAPVQPALPGTWRQRLFVQFMRPSATELVALVEGEIDLSNADDLSGLIACQAAGHRDLVVDLSAVDFIDTTGAVALVALADLLRPAATAMRVVVASRRVLRPFALLGLLDRLTLERRVGIDTLENLGDLGW